MKTEAWSGFRSPVDPAAWKWLPHVEALDADYGPLVSVWAGEPAPKGIYGESPIVNWLVLDPALCDRTGRGVALTSGGLDGGRASQLQYADEFRCSTPSRVLIRVRAVFREPATLRVRRINSKRWLVSTGGIPIDKAVLAVATPAGKPLLYASVSHSGKTAVYTGRSCVPN